MKYNSFDYPIRNYRYYVVYCTVKPVIKGHLRERHILAFIDKWSLDVSLSYLINEGLSVCGLYLQDGLYWEVIFNTGLTICPILLDNACRDIKMHFENKFDTFR